MSEILDMVSDFDWVKARSECSIQEVFQRLVLALEKDVKSRNTSLGREQFSITKNGGSVVVFVKRGDQNTSVTFKIEAGGICAYDENDNPKIRATLTLNGERKCRFKVSGHGTGVLAIQTNVAGTVVL